MCLGRILYIDGRLGVARTDESHSIDYQSSGGKTVTYVRETTLGRAFSIGYELINDHLLVRSGPFSSNGENVRLFHMRSR